MNVLKSLLKRCVRAVGYDIVRLPRQVVPVNATLAARPLPPLGRDFQGLRFSGYALQKLLSDYSFNTVLDVGSGSGEHSRIMAQCGKEVTAVDWARSVYYMRHDNRVIFLQGDYLEFTFRRQFDAVWASHVLEHQANVGLFLKKLFGDCRDGGVIAITVPPLKHEVGGGHLSVWNAGLILYNIIFAGFDCSQASILQYDYNISIIVRKRVIPVLPELVYDKGDIDRLVRFFPPGLSEPFCGDIRELNWFRPLSPSDSAR